MRIAVVGGGVAGICTVHHILKELPDAEVVGFEMSDDIGGTWVYTDRTGFDEFGLPLATSMYKSLRTNLPKEIMQFSDFPIPSDSKSFMEDEEYLQYLNNYTDHFDIRRYYKFRHLVTLVKPLGDAWTISYENVLTKEPRTEEFDIVFICNGHYSQLSIPEYKGIDLFKGKQSHSHEYRTPAPFKGKRVLVVGSGPSGLDISIEVATLAKRLILSHHNPTLFESPFPPHYVQRPDVKEFTENSVIFTDDTSEEIDEILFCTGYAYHAPFLDPSCGIKIHRTHMESLYRQIVNVEHPTMFFIGLPQLCCIIPLTDMQAQYAVAVIKGIFKLPSREAMLLSVQREYADKDKSAFPNPWVATHTMGPWEGQYFAEIAQESGLKAIPLVFCSIRYITMASKSNMYTFRNHKYKILDDKHFLRTCSDGTQEEWETIDISGKCRMIRKENHIY